MKNSSQVLAFLEVGVKYLTILVPGILVHEALVRGYSAHITQGDTTLDIQCK